MNPHDDSDCGDFSGWSRRQRDRETSAAGGCILCILVSLILAAIAAALHYL